MAGPRPGAAGADDTPVGQDDLEPDDHVLDLSVAGGVLPGPATGQPPAHGGQVHGLGPVPQGVPRAVRPAGSGFEVGPEGRAATRASSDVVVDVDDQAVPGAHVEGPRPEGGDARAPHTRSRPATAVTGAWASLQAASTAATWPVVVRSGHHRRPGRDLAPGGPADSQGPPVTSGLHAGPVVAADLAAVTASRAPTRRLVDGRRRRTAQSFGDLGRRGVNGGHRGGGMSKPDWPARRSARAHHGNVVTVADSVGLSTPGDTSARGGRARGTRPAGAPARPASMVRWTSAAKAARFQRRVSRGSRPHFGGEQARPPRWRPRPPPRPAAAVARVRRARTSSTVMAISWRAAHTRLHPQLG